MRVGLVLAAGRGTRVGAARNKMLLPVAGRTLLEHTLDRVVRADCLDYLLVAAAPAEYEIVAELVEQLPTEMPRAVCRGGATRQESVQAALAALPAGTTAVCIHDGARPYIDPAEIERVMAALATHEGALLARPATDTVKIRATADSLYTQPRETVWLAETPQAFRLETLREMYAVPTEVQAAATDDSSLLERLGRVPAFIVAEKPNGKITTREDWQRFAAYVAGEGVLRVGNGYDVHRTCAGRLLIIGGVSIPADFGLDGHSDADVLTHAVMDALLAAAGLRDIGYYFPNTDERFRGADSLLLLAEVRRLLTERNVLIGNVSAALIAERPKLAPYIETMRENLARVLRVEPARVAIQVTTNEGLDDLGAGKGIAATATACVIERMV